MFPFEFDVKKPSSSLRFESEFRVKHPRSRKSFEHRSKVQDLKSRGTKVGFAQPFDVPHRTPTEPLRYPYRTLPCPTEPRHRWVFPYTKHPIRGRSSRGWNRSQIEVTEADLGWHYLPNATRLIRPRLFSTALLV